MTQNQSLKGRLAAKSRRTALVPIQVSDPGAARAEFEKAEQNHLVHRVAQASNVDSVTAKDVAAAKRALDKAKAELRKHFVDVEFAAGSPADVERVLGAHTDNDGGWSVDALPELAALCAVDEELQDADWWTEQLTGGTWSTGERGDLWAQLLSLNIDLPSEGLPKD